MSQRYTFLYVPIEAVGHFNACIGIGQHLLKRGHRVVFATPNSFREKLTPMGFEEEYTQCPVQDESNEKWGEIVASMAPVMAMPPIQKMEFLNFGFYQEVIKKTKDLDEKLREIMARVRPDVVVVDNVAHFPALQDQGVPWVMATSLCPLGILLSKDLPPAFAGLPILNGDKTALEEFGKKQTEVFKDLFQDFKEWVIEKGGPKLEYKISPYWQKFSPFANICMSPREIAYIPHNPNPKGWHRFDAFVRTEVGLFEIPPELDGLPGKLIYFSMGSIGASELGLMRKLIGFLAKAPHRFIVSKGPLGDELDLPKNMWGENCLLQTLVLPKVDLVITHGGNNTVTESFYYGKPILILPLFCDQLDNATRIQETGHGLRCEPYHVTEDELLGAIETLLGNKSLQCRMRAISKRIQGSNNQSRAADVIEAVARNNTCLN